MKRILAWFLAVSGLAVIPQTIHAAPGDPLQIVVSLRDQQARVYQGLQEVTQSRISSGKRGYSTPTGIFSILQKNRYHRSNIYSGAPMPFMQRLTWSGIALHASNSVPNHPASHGCVRLPHGFARQLFSMETKGVHVVIEDEPGYPREINHSVLFQPQKSWLASPNFDLWVNDEIRRQNSGFVAEGRYADEPARIFITRRTAKDDLFEAQRLLNELGHNAGDVDGIMGPATWKAITSFQKSSGREPNGKVDNELIDALYRAVGEQRPANGRLMVRKYFRTVYETEINITQPEKPLGSHLITSSQFDPDKSRTRWISLTLSDRIHRPVHLRTGNTLEAGTRRQFVYDALARIEIDDHARQQVGRLLTPGSSVTISDNGLSIETGAKGTDFIVLTKPQSEEELASAGSTVR